jgi:hypothetical protein
LFTGLGGVAAAVAATQLPIRPAAAAPSGATVQLVTPPERAVDTRVDGPGKISSAQPLDVFVGGLIATGVVGALLNITITETEGSGFLVVNADNATAPNPTSNLNWNTTNQNLANLAVVPAVGTRGVTVTVGGPGRTHIVVDLVGFLTQ